MPGEARVSDPDRSDVRDRPSFLGTGSAALADQGVHGIAMFLVHLLLARWTTELGYGSFAVAFAVYVLLLSLHNALVVEPMLVFGQHRHADDKEGYARLLMWEHGVIGTVSLLAFGGVAIILMMLAQPALGRAFAGLALASPFLLLLWFARRVCFLVGRPALATLGGSVFGLISLLILWGLDRIEALDPLGGWGAMAAGAFVGSVVLLAFMEFARGGAPDRRAVATLRIEHWQYGRWAAAARISMRGPHSLIVILLPVWAGLTASGEYRALLNLTTPTTQLTVAGSVLLLSTLPGLRGQRAFGQWMLRTGYILVFGTAAVALLLGVFHRPIVEWAYGGQYLSVAALLWILAFKPVVGAAAEPLSSGLRSLERPDAVFWAHTAAGAVGTVVALVLIAKYGLTGAAVGSLLLGVLTLLALWLAFRVASAAEGRAGPQARPPVDLSRRST